jgi:hypothetical protein
MQVDQALSSGDASASHEEGGVGRKYALGFQVAEAPRRIAYASGSSRYGEVHEQPHLPTVSLPGEEDSVPQMKEEVRDDEPH